MTSSHWAAIVVLAVVILLFYNLKEKKSVSPTKYLKHSCDTPVCQGTPEGLSQQEKGLRDVDNSVGVVGWGEV